MIGLADCNNFFVSCERVFRPELLGRPVIVLSNNDGCAVALSNEAKALGFHRGDAYFKIREQAKAQDVVVFSGNHRLYGDMSARVMATLRSVSSDIEVYSVDEAFITVPQDVNDGEAMADYGRHVVRRVRRCTGIPISLGIAPSKTLAKIASRFAKKYPGYQGACVIDTPEKAQKALEMTEIDDVWGIGRRLNKRLRMCGITTALDLARLSREDAERLLGNVTYVRTWMELNGQSVIEPEFIAPAKQTITSSRSFASDISDPQLLRQAMTGFASIVGRKLRRQNCFALEVGVFVATNRFHEHDPQYFNTATRRLAEATNDTADILGAALESLDQVLVPHIGYKRAGLMITRLVEQRGVQPSLFANAELLAKRQRLMEAADRINSSPGNPNAVHLASLGAGLADMTRREHASRLYTTRLSDIITINCK